MVRSTRILAAFLSLACLPMFASPVLAQANKKAGEFIPGTVSSIEKEKTGRNYKMKFKATADDAEFEVALKPTTKLAVLVKGDDAFLRPGVMVLTEAVVGTTPNQYTAREFTVFVGSNPPAQAIPDPKAKGVFNICGKLISKEADGLTVQFSPQPSKILFEGAPTVNVKINDASLIKEGDSVEVEGTLIKSKKSINAMAVNVTASEPVNADEYFAALEERTGKKGKSAKSKTAPKSKADKAAEAEAKKAEAEAKKEDAKDGAEKKTEEKKAGDKKE